MRELTLQKMPEMQFSRLLSSNSVSLDFRVDYKSPPSQPTLRNMEKIIITVVRFSRLIAK